MDQQLLVLAYKHIGVLDNRIVNLGNAYRAIEQTAETLAARTWYEGFEAGAEFNPQTSGIPHDPPLNPYETRPGATE
ncbi:hypothetical protein BJF84_13375 [Rhodococcus sp. CUA-806]|nr:hypothetical protein BJF84_13375 [Rhodococcus sp. CUA-806]